MPPRFTAVKRRRIKSPSGVGGSLAVPGGKTTLWEWRKKLVRQQVWSRFQTSDRM